MQMFKVISLTLLVVFCLVYNKKIFIRNQSNQLGYWIISFIGICVYVMALLKLDMSISTTLTQLVKPLVLWIFGGN